MAGAGSGARRCSAHPKHPKPPSKVPCHEASHPQMWDFLGDLTPASSTCRTRDGATRSRTPKVPSYGVRHRVSVRAAPKPCSGLLGQGRGRRGCAEGTEPWGGLDPFAAPPGKVLGLEGTGAEPKLQPQKKSQLTAGPGARRVPLPALLVTLPWWHRFATQSAALTLKVAQFPPAIPWEVGFTPLGLPLPNPLHKSPSPGQQGWGGGNSGRAGRPPWCTHDGETEAGRGQPGTAHRGDTPTPLPKFSQLRLPAAPSPLPRKAALAMRSALPRRPETVRSWSCRAMG